MVKLILKKRMTTGERLVGIVASYRDKCGRMPMEKYLRDTTLSLSMVIKVIGS